MGANVEEQLVQGSASAMQQKLRTYLDAPLMFS